jgi:hypothetical protein
MPRLPAVLLVACLALVGCSTEVVPPSAAPTPSPSATPPASQGAFPLLSVETIGGECAEGACHRLLSLDSDGRLHEVIPEDRIVGTVPKELVDALQVEMDRANFSLIESRPFTGECPTAVDGQELIYTFHLVAGDEEIRSCTVAIDERHPLFRAVAAVMALVGS